jgi:hypothetical protein
MRVVRFNPDEDLILVKARVFGKQGRRRITLALDTAASHTHIAPDIIDELGYSPIEGDAMTSVTSAIGREPGYMLRVQRIEALGVRLRRLSDPCPRPARWHRNRRPARTSFLTQFNYEIRSAEGRILVEQTAGTVGTAR